MIPDETFTLRYIILQPQREPNRRREPRRGILGRHSNEHMTELLDAAFATDDRAVSPVLGVALLFAIAAIGLSVWQTAVIPQQNAEVEFNHYAEIQDDMQEVREAHMNTVNTGQPESPTLQLGATYQSRILGVNPPNPQGNLETWSLGAFEIHDAPIADSGELLGTVAVCGEYRPETVDLRYDPAYNRLSDSDTPPIVYENTVVYRRAAGGETLIESGQVLIQGSTINILPVQSDADRSRMSTTLTLESQGYPVEKTLTEDATPKLVVPTNLDESTWRNDLLASQLDDGTVTDVNKSNGKVRITLGNLQNVNPNTDSRWTVRCAITTDGDETNILGDVDEPPKVLNGGVGRGGTTEHTAETNSDLLVIPNGRWIDVDSIAEIRLGPTATTDVPNQGGFNGGQGMGVSYKIEDGASDRTVYMTVEVTGDPGNWQAKTVKLTDDPNNCCQSKSLTPEAAREIRETGEPDVLDVENYATSSFQTQDGNFGGYIEMIRSMEDATIRITGLHGRVDMQVVSGDVDLTVADADKRQRYVYNNTSSIDFEVTAEGLTDGRENVDLKVRDSQGQQLDSTSPRVDRETIDLNRESETFTLTWQPEWGSLSSGTSYEVIAQGETDQTFAEVRVLQQGNAYVDVEIVDHDGPVEYGDDLTAEVRATNVGDKQVNDTQLGLSLAGSSGPQEQIDLDRGESKTVTMTYDTGNLDTSNIGETTLKATSNNEKVTTPVNITRPKLILDPSISDLPAKQPGLNQSIAFTLGEKTGGASINIDLRDTGSAVRYDANADRNWNVVEGNGSIGLNTNNNRVTSVTYQTNSSHDLAGDRIVLDAGATNTTTADPNVLYTVQYELTSANNYPQGETNSTTFETTEPS